MLEDKKESKMDKEIEEILVKGEKLQEGDLVILRVKDPVPESALKRLEEMSEKTKITFLFLSKEDEYSVVNKENAIKVLRELLEEVENKNVSE